MSEDPEDVPEDLPEIDPEFFEDAAPTEEAEPAPTEEIERFEPTGRREREIAGEAAVKRGDFLSLMGHLYRGAMSRSTTWRTRLDRTSNWSVVIVATLLTWAFATADNPHSIILLGMGVVSIFWFIEARRYRMYDVWRSRVRMLEENVFANALDPSGAEQAEWRSLLSQDLRRPAIKITLLEALGRRLRRIYMALLTILLLAWVVRLGLLSGAGSLTAEAGIWTIPGEAVILAVVAYYVILLAVAYWPREREAKGRLREPEEGESWSKDIYG